MPTDDESIQVWIVRLAEQTAESWRPVLSSSEWEKAMRFRQPADQVRSAVTRGVLRTLLSHYLDLPADRLEFAYNQFGKPCVAGIEFNVSHSGDYAMLAFSPVPIGIDIEKIAGQRVVDDLSRRVLTPAEHARFLSLAEARRERTFFEIWTLKESIMKGVGSGLSIAPESIEISFYPEEPRLRSTSLGPWTLQILDIGDPNYAASLAFLSRAHEQAVTIHHFGAMHVISNPSAQRR